jgi:TonB family protein
MKVPKRKDDYLRVPRYPGGKTAFQEFITKNLKYPKEALDARIDGGVVVGYSITDNGLVVNPHIIKGLGYGCDEEALRVISLLRYGKVKNRKVRVTINTKTTIHFHLPKLSINYSITETSSSPVPNPRAGNDSYTYTIEF